ncbi:tlde1 domain-containing protein [Bordetella bronchialis]|nr:tlde1 domain-containing protein [Bordetella bronchialis]
MRHDMFYDGQVLDWPGHGKFRASSGLPGHQMPDRYCAGDSGPIPPGYYKIMLADRGPAQDDGRHACALKPAWGMQSIPRGTAAGECEPYWANWGWNRARMEPADEATRHRCTPARGGFYLHDSIKGYSHGCIEVEGRIFPLLRTYSRGSHRDSMILLVRYVAGRSTYGGTRAAP